MAKNKELKKVDIKNHTCYYFDDIINIMILTLIIFYWMKNHTKIF